MTKTIRAINYSLFSLLSLGVAIYAFYYIRLEVNPYNFFQIKMALTGYVAPIHFFTGGMALAVAPLQLSRKLRLKYKAIHRLLGLLYVVCVLMGGLTGLVMAMNATGGWVAKTGFTIMSLLWLLTTTLAYIFIIKGDIKQHQIWIYRSIAITATAITLRLFLGFGLGILHLSFLTVYVPTSWLSWVLNLMICEFILYRRHYFRSIHAVT